MIDLVAVHRATRTAAASGDATTTRATSSRTSRATRSATARSTTRSSRSCTPTIRSTCCSRTSRARRRPSWTTARPCGSSSTARTAARTKASARVLKERGELAAPGSGTMPGIRKWFVDQPEQVRRGRRSQRVVRVLQGVEDAGAVGSQDVVLTPRRSMAIDRAFIAHVDADLGRRERAESSASPAPSPWRQLLDRAGHRRRHPRRGARRHLLGRRRGRRGARRAHGRPGPLLAAAAEGRDEVAKARCRFSASAGRAVAVPQLAAHVDLHADGLRAQRAARPSHPGARRR